MRTLISHHSEFHFLFTNHSLLCTNKKPIFYFPRDCLVIHQKTVQASSIRASCTARSSASYNGWDDLRVWVDSDELGKSNHVKKLLISLGIYDKKYVIICILGFVCALAISRVKVSSIVVFPATAVVFAVGFSFGFVNGGSSKGFNSIGGKRRVNGDSLGIFVEKLKTLVELFDGFDVKIGDLKNVVNKAIDYESVELSDLENYVNDLDSLGGLVLKGRDVVEDCIGGVSGDMQEAGRNSSNKNSRKKKDIGNKNGFNLFEFVGSFVSGNGAGSKPTRTKEIRKDGELNGVDNRAVGAVRGSVARRASDSLSGMDASNPNVGTMNYGGRMNKLGGGNGERESILRGGKARTTGSRMDSRASVDSSNGRFNYQSTRFVDNQQSSFNMSAHREIREWGFDDNMSSYSEFDFTEGHQVNENSLNSQDILGNTDGVGSFSQRRENVDYRSYETNFEHERISEEDELHTRKYRFWAENDRGPFSSSAVSDDVLFDKYLGEANALLKKAKDCIKVTNDEMLAQDMLYESAKLLSQAIEMKPMSLLAIGQLGNTYLLHGELKLRMSRALRTLLSRRGRGDLDLESWSDLLTSLDETLPNKDRVATLLVETCEECETLLVQAGRKYKTALLIDGSDVRALYNWGLALFFRAQLIADIGPETALDADKLFLAAIDKFDAMMSRGNVHAPDALFRWGVALQQRSHLRPNSSRDKQKLLQQAKRLYEDALDMGSKNLQVREALTSCLSELNVRDT